jgi:hypothetical protein
MKMQDGYEKIIHTPAQAHHFSSHPMSMNNSQIMMPQPIMSHQKQVFHPQPRKIIS